MVVAEDVKEAFRAFDEDGSGTLTLEEVMAILVRPCPGGRPFSAEEMETAKAQFASWDKNGDGVLSIEEFAAAWPSLRRGPSRPDDSLDPCADGIGSLRAVQAQLNMSDLSAMPALPTRASSLTVHGGGGEGAEAYEPSAMAAEMQAEMAKIQKKEEKQALLAKAKAAFDKYDTDSSFSISASELGPLLAELELPLKPQQIESYVTSLFTKYDKDGSGSLSWGEFEKLYLHCFASERVKKKLAKQALTEMRGQDAREAFAKHDTDKSGTLTAAELGPLLREALGPFVEHYTAKAWDDYVADVIQRGDRDGSGDFDQEEFAVLYSKCLASEELIAKYEERLLQRISESGRQRVVAD